MHVGYKNLKHTYKSQEKNLIRVEEKNNLEVIVNGYLKTGLQCMAAAVKLPPF